MERRLKYWTERLEALYYAFEDRIGQGVEWCCALLEQWQARLATRRNRV